VVSPIENQTILTGRVIDRQPHDSVDRWDVLRLRVSAADNTPTDRNLLGEAVGGELSVAVNRDELPEGDLTGWQFTGRVRLAGPETVIAVPEGAGLGRPSLRPPEAGAPESGAPESAAGPAHPDHSNAASHDPSADVG
jgi:hypothetical protein